MELTVWISIAMMVGSILFVIGRDVYRRLIMPFLCYKFVVFDRDDEYTFYKRKKHAIIREKLKGFMLFEKKGEEGEFYTLPLDEAYGDVNDNFSKRDDTGFITYYYYRNNNVPIKIIPDQGISMIKNDARASAKLLKTNIFDTSLSLDPVPKEKLNWLLIMIIIIAMVAVIMFQDKIGAIF